MASFDEREASFCDKNKQLELLGKLSYQFQEKLFCDVIIKVGNREFSVHANVLAASSPYFSTFLLQDVPRSFCQKTPQIIEIQVDTETQETYYQDAVESILKFIYTGIIAINYSNATQIHELARIMQLEGIEGFCYNFLQGRVQGTNVYGSVVTMQRHTGTNTDLSCVKSLIGFSDLTHHDKNFGMLGTKFRGGKMVSVGCQTVQKPCPDEMDRALVTQGTSTEFHYFLPMHRKLKTNVSFAKAQTNTDMDVDEEEASEEHSSFKLQLSTRSGRRVKIKSFEFPSGVAALETTKKHTIQINIPKPENQVPIEVDSGRDGCRSDIVIKKPDISEDLSNEKEQEAAVETHEEKDKMEINEGHEKEETIEEKVVNDEINQSASIKMDTAIETSNEYSTDTLQEQEEKAYKDVPLPPVVENLVDFSKKEKKFGMSSKKGIAAKSQTKIQYARRPGKEYSCGECEFITNKVREMTAHTLSHKYQQMVCFYCDSQFENTGELDEHMCSHQGKTPFLCTKCSATFKTRTLLNLHLPKHFDDKPYVCEICCQSFKWKHALKNHAVVHEAKKQHLCDICGYSSSHKMQLKAHKLIHSGDTFKCDWQGCSFETTKKQNLRNHMLTHTKEKPHVCELCGQAFTLRKNMQRHMLLHIGKKLVKCTACEFATTRQDKLKEHMLKVHGVGTPPERRPTAASMNDTSIQPSGKFVSSNNMDMIFEGMQLVLLQGNEGEEVTQQNIAHSEVQQPEDAAMVDSSNAFQTTQALDMNPELVCQDSANGLTNLIVIQDNMSGQVEQVSTQVLAEEQYERHAAESTLGVHEAAHQLLPDWTQTFQQLSELQASGAVSHGTELTHIMLMNEGSNEDNFSPTVLVVKPENFQNQTVSLQNMEQNFEQGAIQQTFDEHGLVHISAKEVHVSGDGESYVLQG